VIKRDIFTGTYTRYFCSSCIGCGALDSSSHILIKCMLKHLFMNNQSTRTILVAVLPHILQELESDRMAFV
jgi:hypothetical protein